MKLPKIFELSKTTRSVLVNKALYLLLGAAFLIVAHHIGTIVKRIIFTKGNSEIRDLKDASATEIANQKKQIRKTKVLYIILGQVAYYAIMGLALLLVLKLFGIEATSIIALAGAAGFTIGLGLQGTFSDIASGILLGIFQTYTIGDLVEIDGITGRVKDFNLTHTILVDMDTNSQITIPNRKISESNITNYSKSDQTRVIIKINVSNSYQEFDKLIPALQKDLATMPGVVSVPAPPVVGVDNMGDVGTIVAAKFYIDHDNFPALVMPIKSKVRQLLTDMKVPLVDPF